MIGDRHEQLLRPILFTGLCQKAGQGSYNREAPRRETGAGSCSDRESECRRGHALGGNVPTRIFGIELRPRSLDEFARPNKRLS